MCNSFSGKFQYVRSFVYKCSNLCFISKNLRKILEAKVKILCTYLFKNRICGFVTETILFLSMLEYIKMIKILNLPVVNIKKLRAQ